MSFRTLSSFLLLVVVACGGGVTPPTSPLSVALPAPTATAVAADESGSSAREDDAAVPIFSRNPTWGSRTALVTIVEFSDFQCPYCARVVPTLSALRETYGPDNLRVVWKNSPLPGHPNARPAAEAAMGVFQLAGPRAFWKFHDAAFADQRSLAQDSYERWAREAGVTDMAAFRAGLASHRWAVAVEADLADARALSQTGTPSFFINGISIIGAQPLDKFKSAIDAEMAKARAKVIGGTPRDKVYAELARVNFDNAPKADDLDDEEGEADDTKTVFKVPVGSSPVRGNANAPVTIIEFADFQCPFCGRVEPTLEAIRKKYGDKVRMVWKNEPLPFHTNAEPAAEAAIEVRAERGNDGFWAMHDKLLAEQLELSKSPKDVPMAFLTKLAAEAKASPDKVRRAVTAKTHAKEIDADADLSEDFQANGTPHFFINGRRLVGAQPEEKFDQMIDEELAHAQALLARGTAPAALYDALIRSGKGPPEPEKKSLSSLPSSDPARGNLSAKVTLHEWSDFQCPFCSRVEPTLEKVMKDYGTRIKVVWHDLPLPMHPDAPLAAQAGREAFQQKGSTAFWALHDLMFADQQHIKRSDLDVYARSLRLDMQKWGMALDNGLHQRELDAEKKAADDMEISGTPAFVVVPGSAGSGYFISGAQSYARFRKILDRALAEAQ